VDYRDLCYYRIVKVLGYSFLGVGVLLSVANGQEGGGGLPGTLPPCGEFVRRDFQYPVTVKAINGADCDGGAWYQMKNGFKFKRTITQDIYTGGVKYYCSDWEADGCDYYGGPSLPACPSNTCKNP
jgi:hypothetical protein